MGDTISLCMIVKNEEDFIVPCLEAAVPHVDEVVIVDTGSTDETLKKIEEIRKAHPDVPFILNHIAWADDFAGARNVSLKHATKDWVLLLDADEIIAPEDFARIKEMLNKSLVHNGRAIEGFMLNQRTYCDDASLLGFEPTKSPFAKGKKGLTTAKIVRLFKRADDVRFEYRVHESVEPSLKKRGAIVANTKIPIHHYGGVQRAGDEKQKKYLQLGLEEVKQRPDDPKPLYEIALIYQHRREYAKALECFDKVIVLDKQYRNVYLNKGVILSMIGDYKLAAITYREGIRVQPGNQYLYFNLAGLLLKLNHPEEAMKIIKAAAEINPNNVGAFMKIIQHYKAKKQGPLANDLVDFLIARLPEGSSASTQLAAMR